MSHDHGAKGLSLDYNQGIFAAAGSFERDVYVVRAEHRAIFEDPPSWGAVLSMVKRFLTTVLYTRWHFIGIFLYPSFQ